MLGGPIGAGKGNSLMSEYSLKLGEAVLRSRTHVAEKTARVEAEIANRIKSEFISNMSHELRTPLNTVIGFSKLLTEHERRHLAEGEVVEYARLIHDAAGNLLAIINDILDISKIQAGHYRLDMNEINLDEVIEAVVAALRPTYQNSGISMSIDLGLDGMVVRGDGQKLKQVFGNLIGNAVKFTPTGGSVTIQAVVAEDGAITITIVDTGVGMDPQEIEVALAPFGQVDGARTRWREGTGLGLPIAKALLELHGGRLEITSEKSIGTRVRATLPSPQFVAMMQQRANLGLARA